MKKEEIEITYSYWDGSGHRMSVKVRFKAPIIINCSTYTVGVQCKKGDDIGTFLEKCRQQVPELRGVSVDNLMYVKEDLIIPHVRGPIPIAFKNYELSINIQNFSTIRSMTSS